MEVGSWALLVLAAVAAVGDWVAVARREKTLEYICKPLATLLLIGVALTLDPSDGDARMWFVIALLLSLLGDVLLMLPPTLFIGGLTAFLLAHLAYIIGFWVDGVGVLAFAIGLALATLAVLVVGGRILDMVRRSTDEGGMVIPVGFYMIAISVMVASAVGTQEPLAVGGGVLFYISDTMIGWRRFGRAPQWTAVAIMVTYHLAQAGLILSLLD